MSRGGPENQNVSSAPWQEPKQWEAVERFTNMMFCCLFLLLQGHHKDKNNPPWQICFQKVSFCFSIISEKYCPIVLTPIECFDRGLMYYPVFPVIQMLLQHLFWGRTWECEMVLCESYQRPSLFPDTCWAVSNSESDENLRANTFQWEVIVQMQIRSPLVGRTIYQCSLISQAAICLSWPGFKMRWESCSWCLKRCW